METLYTLKVALEPWRTCLYIRLLLGLYLVDEAWIPPAVQLHFIPFEGLCSAERENAQT